MGGAYGAGIGVQDGDTLALADKAGRNSSFGFFNRGKRSDRKTVTFGDSSAVRSLPLWSLFALVSLVGFWFVSTYAWGFPEEFNDPELSDKLRVAACDCNDSFSQLLSPLQFPSIRDTWNTFFILIDEDEEGVPRIADRRELQWTEELTEGVIAITSSDSKFVRQFGVVELLWESPGVGGDKPKPDQ